MARDIQTNPYIDQLIELVGSALEPSSFVEGLDEAQADALLLFHSSIASRFGARAASRACSRLGGVPALQQLLKAMHKRQLQCVKQTRLMNEIDDMLKNTPEIDLVRTPGPTEKL